ncbi:hypothetical protein EIN_381320 [Entamoeba invadens IP1]|uniref:Uncharacterized protein n=1 Tax=Entamoeba invadens IP1 TaxID=370355 RepID=A0A0A1UAZ5_ENTIV|nr:hypothetical protein EIN_381320 [Entamoeba invadens IP1]ELP92165.1 hypothetical protein EIN_381320 [Entamoeba invadens IP1]|eukprot:XP_004258936.1 hypothetical protein EIN_381320 [Entamoeba invadens IP1]
MKVSVGIIIKTLTFLWVLACGILLVSTGAVHFAKNKRIKYQNPKNLPAYYSQGTFSITFQAGIVIALGAILFFLPFMSFLSGIKIVKQFSFVYSRLVVVGFLIISGLLAFPLSGFLGLVVGVILWFSVLVIIISAFFTTSISTFKDEEDK